MAEVKLKRVEGETHEERTLRLLLITMDHLEKLSPIIQMNLKDLVPSETLNWWRDAKCDLTRARNAEIQEKKNAARVNKALAMLNPVDRAILLDKSFSPDVYGKS